MPQIPAHVFRHRATVRRARTTYLNGSPTTLTVTVATGEPCLVDGLGKEFVPSVGATSTQITEADRYATLFVASASSAVWDATVDQAEREIRPSDTLTVEMGGGRAPMTYTVQSVPSPVEGWAGPSHRELRVKQV